ncbi:MAG TPA: class I SAM-dependent methyltransferase, partial [Actinomycetota bacterium]
PAKPAGDRQYQLPADHADALANQDSLDFGAHKAVDIVRAGRQLPELVEAFRTGRGLPPLAWAPEGRAEFNRPRFVNLLGREWLPAVGELDRRLSSVPPARIADIACGTGWSSIAMAHAYPKVRVDGFDLDEDAIARARENAASEGVEDRVSFEARDAAEVGQSFRYDLATIFEALHDMARPVDALRAARGLLDDTGWGLLLADERVADRFVVPADDRERYVYGWSVVTCLPSAMVDPQSAGTGAVMRPDTVRAYAADAGFAGVETLPIETDYWRFYRLVP